MSFRTIDVAQVEKGIVEALRQNGLPINETGHNDMHIYKRTVTYDGKIIIERRAVPRTRTNLCKRVVPKKAEVILQEAE